MSLILFALLVGIVAVVAAAAYAGRMGWRLWRDLKAGLRGFGDAMDEFGRKLDSLAAHEPPELERLAASVERLRRSAAELSVLLNALRRVREQWSGLLAVYPRK